MTNLKMMEPMQMTKKKYKKLSIHDKINYRAELKLRQARMKNTASVVFELVDIAIEFLKDMQAKHNNKNIYQLVK